MKWFEAVETGDIKEITRLLQKNPQLINSKKSGSTALMIAAEKGLVVSIKSKNNSTIKILHNDKIQLVKLLIDNGAQVNTTNENGRTALMLASEKNSLKVAQLLIDHGADVNAQDYNGTTALIYAATNVCIQVSKLLIENGADTNVMGVDGATALTIAVGEESFELAKLLIHNEADVDLCDDPMDYEYDNYLEDVPGRTPLTRAVLLKSIELVKLLLDNNASVDLEDGEGRTALMHASALGLTDIMKLLLEKGAMVDSFDQFGCTPLLLATYHIRPEAVELLLERNANPCLGNEMDQSPMEMAVRLRSRRFIGQCDGFTYDDDDYFPTQDDIDRVWKVILDVQDDDNESTDSWETFDSYDPYFPFEESDYYESDYYESDYYDSDEFESDYDEEEPFALCPCKISNINLKKLKALVKNDSTCPICLDQCKAPAEITVLGCNHFYHSQCVKEWMDKGKDTCPSCRTEIETMRQGSLK